MVPPNVNEVRRGLVIHNLFYEQGEVLERDRNDISASERIH